MLYISFPTGKEVVDTNDIIPFLDQSCTQVGSNKTCAATYENSFHHKNTFFNTLNKSKGLFSNDQTFSEK